MRIFRLFLVGAGFLFHMSSQGIAGPVCEPAKGYVAVDVSEQVNEGFLRKIKEVGIGTVFRYYDWTNETLRGKTVTKRELALIARQDLNVAVVFQHNNDCMCTFMNPQRGRMDADRSLALATSFSQPRGSAVYFGVDGVDGQYLNLLKETNLPSGESQAGHFIRKYVRNYFEQISVRMKSSGYKIGVYGSGLVCKYLLDEKLVDYCWLANATSWPGYQEMEKSKRWVLRQHLPTKPSDCFGLEVDLNSGNGSVHDFGQWKPKP
jgi:hypothetical protein